MIISSVRQKLTESIARLVDRHVVPFRFAHPVISFTFDDYPCSALDVGGRILESEGISGTYYTAFGLAETDTAAGAVGRLGDLAACVARGHEIACHTYDHLDCMTASADEVALSLARNQGVARGLGLPPFSNFAYPFGHYGVTGKRIAMQSYASARTVTWGVNRGNVDLALLKSVPIYSRGGSPRLALYLDELQSCNGWLIFYTHDVSERPSPYGCTPSKLKSVIRRAREMGASVLPVGAVVDKLRKDQVANAARTNLV
jgi:peptidoglycan/xylan/chitin deacetylase (PgdA/CDA1 family)